MYFDMVIKVSDHGVSNRKSLHLRDRSILISKPNKNIIRKENIGIISIMDRDAKSLTKI